MENDEVQEVSSSDNVNEEVQEVSAPVTEGDQAAETEKLNETITEIKEILLESNETSSDDTLPVQQVPIITEEEFIKFNNNFCVGLTCLVLICGIICGSVIALLFKGIFKEK